MMLFATVSVHTMAQTNFMSKMDLYFCRSMKAATYNNAISADTASTKLYLTERTGT